MKQALVVATALVAAACSPPLLKLPGGRGVTVAAPAAAAALDEASMGCGAVRTLTADVMVSGSAGGHRVRGRLSAGVAAPSSARLEAVAPFGAPVFIFVATGADATLLLPRDGRILEHARPDAVLEAVAGIPLDGADLRDTLTGCVVAPEMGGAIEANQFGATWLALRTTNGDDIYLHRALPADRWDLVAIVRASRLSNLRWRADFNDRQAGVPRTIRLTSIDDGGTQARRFDLKLVLSQVDVTMPLGPEVFTVLVPPGATRISLDELRRSGAFGAE